MSTDPSLTYKSAGVDIDAGEQLVERIRGAVKRTARSEVIGGIGGFGGLFRVPQGYTDPVLVSGTDGVGTKARLAIAHNLHDGIGIDLVAMCVNDIAVLGAQPLFFLDYYSTPKLDVEVAARVVTSIARGCEIAGAALLGGETAEHPGAGTADDYDLAGFCVGIVDKSAIIDGSTIAAGDTVIGIASSGAHSNGYSLIRRVLERSPGDADTVIGTRTLINHLLEPTRIYTPAVAALCGKAPPRGLAHITGGGLLENIPRVLPDGLGVRLEESAWTRPAVFDWLAEAGVARTEMHRTFNCGLGMVVIVDRALADETLSVLRQAGETANVVGVVTNESSTRVEIV